MNIISYFSNSYKSCTTTSTTFCDTMECCTARTCRGPHPGAKVQYLNQHPNYNTKHRTVRSLDHSNLPNFVGPYFMKKDEENSNDFYFALMMLLFKPWRDLHFDLKESTQSWREAFKIWLSTTSPMI